MQNNFLSPILFVLVIVFVLLSIVAIFYLYITAKNRERLALIEKGMNPNLARGDFWSQVAIIGAGVCLGLMGSDLIGSNYGPLMGILFAGIGLVIYNVIRQSKMRKDRMG
ncbi:MAG: hypothetical protein ABIY51_09105 [Ferruginibacter sp.]